MNCFRTNFILLTDPERESRDLYWLQKEAAERKLNVQITIVSEYLASLAVVGPSSRDVSVHKFIIFFSIFSFH